VAGVLFICRNRLDAAVSGGCSHQVIGQRPIGKRSTMHGNACTRHTRRGPEDYRNGRCIYCQREAQRRYARSCRDARRRLKAIEAALAA
jgi:hypothetical protein